MTYHHLGESGEAWRIHEQLKGFEPRFAATLKRDMDNTPRQKAGDEDSSIRSANCSREVIDATH